MLWDSLGLARDGPHEDQAAANLEVLVRLARDEELAARVDIEDPVKLLGRDILDVAERDDAAVGAHNVELAERLVRLLEQANNLVNVAHVGLDADRIGAVLLDQVDDLLRCSVAVGIVDNHLGATASELEGHFPANAATCGPERSASCAPWRHGRVRNWDSSALEVAKVDVADATECPPPVGCPRRSVDEGQVWGWGPVGRELG